MTDTEADYSRRKFELEVALDARAHELTLFWQRSLFFWGFIAAAFTALAVIERDGTSPRLGVAISCFGCVCSWAWVLINKGSRYWQENWERKVNDRQSNVVGLLFRPESEQPRRRTREIWAGRKQGLTWMATSVWSGSRYAPARVVIALSMYVALMWTCLMAYALVRMWVPVSLGTPGDVGVTIFAFASMAYVELMRRGLKGGDSCPTVSDIVSPTNSHDRARDPRTEV